MGNKSIFASRTFWFNLAAFAAFILANVPQYFADSAPAFVAWVVGALPLINIVLRMLTGKPVVLGKGTK